MLARQRSAPNDGTPVAMTMTCDPGLHAKVPRAIPICGRGAAGPKFATICYKIRLNQSIDSIPDTSASAAAAAAKNAVTSVSLCSKKSFVFKLL